MPRHEETDGQDSALEFVGNTTVTTGPVRSVCAAATGNKDADKSNRREFVNGQLLERQLQQKARADWTRTDTVGGSFRLLVAVHHFP
jgi:hypothetical protein